MGRIDFEGWNTQIDDLKELNGAPEVRRLGLEFKQFPGLITASRAGNVAAYYLILQEVRNRLVSGGFKFEGKWIVPPASRNDLCRLRKGGMIHLQPDSRGKGKRSVHLSQATMAWLERSILLWPGEGGPLFRAKGGGAWTSARWKHAFRRFMEGQHLHVYSPSSMRLGKARDLLQQGAHVLDVQEAAGWCVTGPVLRILPRSGGVALKGDQTEDENAFRVPDRLRMPRDMHTGDLFGHLAHG